MLPGEEVTVEFAEGQVSPYISGFGVPCQT